MRSFGAIVVAVAFGVVLEGCSNTPRVNEMVPGAIDISHKHAGSVYVQATGGQSTSAMSGAYLGNPEFKQAIEQAITKFEIFASIAPTSVSDYTLNVEFDSDAPSWGFNMTVDHRAHWKLSRTGSPQMLLDEQIDSSSKATVGQAFDAATRRKLGIEQAAKLNVEAGLKRVGQIEF
jgi:hypothetical protein